jgi:hypothetical protein
VRPIALVVALTLALSGWVHDYRSSIAMGVLYPSSDAPYSPLSGARDRAFAGALLGRFPVASSAAEVKKFLI